MGVSMKRMLAMRTDFPAFMRRFVRCFLVCALAFAVVPAAGDCSVGTTCLSGLGRETAFDAAKLVSVFLRSVSGRQFACAAPSYAGSGVVNKGKSAERKKAMPKVYCKFCGKSFNNVRSLTGANCMRHPNGACKGRHELYEGTEKSTYTCKYCGKSFKSLTSLTGADCMRHPNGACKGKHSPAL